MSKHDSLYGGWAEVEVNLLPVLELTFRIGVLGHGSGLEGEPSPN